MRIFNLLLTVPGALSDKEKHKYGHREEACHSVAYSEGRLQGGTDVATHHTS